jgi:hypothetical protein
MATTLIRRDFRLDEHGSQFNSMRMSYKLKPRHIICPYPGLCLAER